MDPTNSEFDPRKDAAAHLAALLEEDDAPLDEVRRELRESGIDPDAASARFRSLARRVEGMERRRNLVQQVGQVRELMERIRSGLRLGEAPRLMPQAPAFAFRKRTGDDERDRAALLEDLEALERLLQAEANGEG